MNTPTSLLIEQLKSRLDAAIRVSKLPPSVLEPIVGCYFFQLQAMAKEEALTDAEEYKKASEVQEAQENKVKEKSDVGKKEKI
jgi:hypothetical protein